ncbi:MAG: hypothetical protein RPU34_05245 [Candidatus Sedimenticola sp. (ex Thyasira tokunagai)]
MSENTALIVIEEINPAVVFTAEGIEPVIARIEEIAMAHVPDMSTAKGRQAVKSLAFKVAQSKVLLDDAGKAYVADIKAKTKAIDASRKIARDRLDTLKTKVRAKLTEYEEAEKKREAEEKAAEQARVDGIKQLIATNFNESVITGISSKPSTAITEIIDKISALAIGDEYQEFASDAENAKATLLSSLMQFRENKEIQEEEDERRREETKRLAAEREELDRLREEQEEAKKKEEAKLKAERDQLEEERRQIEEERQAAEDQRAKEEEERQAAARAEEARIQEEKEAEEKAEQERLETERLEQEAKAKTEREEALRPDKEKLVAFARAVNTYAMTEAGKIGLDSEEAQILMSSALEGIDGFLHEMLGRCDNLGGA